jgi:hypothetical protein
MKISSDLRESFRRNEVLSSLASHLLVSLMMICLAISFVQFVNRLLPEWRMGFLPWWCGLVSLEALITLRRMNRASDLETNAVLYRVTEFIVIIIVTSGLSYLWQGGGLFLADLLGLSSPGGGAINFVDNFVSIEFLSSLMVVAAVWGLSTQYGQDLIDLEGDEIILQELDQGTPPSDRASTRRRMISRMLTVGIGMVLITALVRIDIRVIWGDRPVPRTTVGNVVLYFLLGLALLSLTQFAANRATWAWERIPVNQNIGRQWLTHSLVFLVLISSLAFLLPTGYTMGFLPAIGTLLNILLNLFYTLILFLIYPFFVLFSALAQLFDLEVSPMQPPMDFERFSPEPPPAPGQLPPWVEAIRTIMFWGILLAVVLYAFSIYFRQNRDLILRLRKLPGFAWLATAWRWFVTRFRMGVEIVPELVRAGWEKVRSLVGSKPELERWRLINPRRLPARQRVLFYYLALLRRSQETAIARKAWQTPYEYARDLESALVSQNWQKLTEHLAASDSRESEVTQPLKGSRNLANDGTRQLSVPGDIDAIHALTEEFMEARYTRHPVTDEQATNAQSAWERLRQYFTHLKTSRSKRR